MIDNMGEAFAIIARDGRLDGYFGDHAVFDSVERARTEKHDLILAIPFAQAVWGDRPMSAIERLAQHQVSGIRVARHEELDAFEFLSSIAPETIEIADGHFDLEDQEFAQKVSDVVRSEISEGHGSNFVVHRTFRGSIGPRTISRELAMFRSLMIGEEGTYWTFLVHFPDHSLIGASPEMHLARDRDGLTVMNPISGTYRYPTGGPDEGSLREFLASEKERNELYMVVDEELKIMSELCDTRPWISDPEFRRMSRLAHTEYHIFGHSKLPWFEALKRSMVAPTVLGGPLESAFRMAARNDASPRGYFGGVLARVSRAPSVSLDSVILIRTARVDAGGEMSLPVGATIVRDSDPLREAAETTTKVAGMLSAFTAVNRDHLDALVGDLLENRKAEVADFWTRAPWSRPVGDDAQELRALVVDHEDRFTAMLAAHLESLGLRVSVAKGSLGSEALSSVDLLVLGPGPGDPHDLNDGRIVEARRLARWALDQKELPVLAVCLSHQLVCKELGLEVARLPYPNQGSQKTVPFFGREVTVGFYNSFSAYRDDRPRDFEVQSDPRTG